MATHALFIVIDDGYRNGLLYVDYAKLHGSSILEISMHARKICLPPVNIVTLFALT